MKSRASFIVVTALVIMSVITLLIGCGQPTPEPTPTLEPTPTPKVLKYGVCAALSGTPAAWGLGVLWGVEQAAEELNEAGGVTVAGQPYIFEVVKYDDKYTTSGGKAAGEYLVYEAKVRAISSLGTAPTISLLEVTEPAKVIVFHGCNSKLPSYYWCYSRVAGL